MNEFEQTPKGPIKMEAGAHHWLWANPPCTMQPGDPGAASSGFAHVGGSQNVFSLKAIIFVRALWPRSPEANLLLRVPLGKQHCKMATSQTNSSVYMCCAL